MNRDAVHTEERGECVIQIFQDDMFDSMNDLRGDEECCGILLYANFGRYGNASTPTCEKWNVEQAREKQEEMKDSHWIWPVYAYIHGGVTISMGSFSCEWDSGQCGYIAIDKKEYPDQKEAEKVAESCVETTDMILTGQVYGYVVSEKGEDDSRESCWGFVGPHDTYVLEEARNVADRCTEDIKAEKKERAYWEARDTVTV